MVWHQDEAWSVPEGLGGAVEPFVKKGTDKIEYSRLVKP
jgi:hypothetical protein